MVSVEWLSGSITKWETWRQLVVTILRPQKMVNIFIKLNYLSGKTTEFEQFPIGFIRKK